MGFFNWLFDGNGKQRKHKHHRKPWQTKCFNCGHNVIKKRGVCYHRNYNSGLRPGEDGDDPSEFGYIEYTKKCKYPYCECTKPRFKTKAKVILPISPGKEKTGQTWSQKEKEQLKKEVKSGKSISQIAKIHKRREDAIFYKIRDEKII